METTAGFLIKNTSNIKPLPSIIGELGYDPNFVNPTPIGMGAEHVVYLYAPPFEQKKALKIPRRSAISFKLDLDVEKLDRTLIERYLPRYSVPSRVLQRGDSYLIEAHFVAGKHLTLQEVDSYREQVDDMFECNARMVREAGASVDFFGLDGVKDVATLAGLRGKPYRLANVLVSDDDSLKVVDNSLQHMALFGTTFERMRGKLFYESSRLTLWALAA